MSSQLRLATTAAQNDGFGAVGSFTSTCSAATRCSTVISYDVLVLVSAAQFRYSVTDSWHLDGWCCRQDLRPGRVHPNVLTTRSAVSFAVTAASLSSSSTSRVEEDGEDGERERSRRSKAPFELIKLTELCELTLPLAEDVNVELPCHWLGT
uniref:Uncharacterized protein n=1 Tax=Plectus sambesii TaxID=2011161 RepID=A0A914X5P1_9BILA